MSGKLSLKGALARREDASEERRASSDSHAGDDKSAFSLVARHVRQPVEVAKTLKALGLSLRKAHDALDRLAKKEAVVVPLDAGDAERTIERLDAVGVAAFELVLPNPDIKKIREKLGLSQREFACRFFLELDTVQNWEQGRHQPDAPTKLLMKVIECCPEVVDAVLIAKPMTHGLRFHAIGDWPFTGAA
jgi:DNA-binding transcriptional regulator YiaG